MASTATRNSDSGVRSAVEEASGYALVLNRLFSHTRQIRPRKVLKSLTLFKFFPGSTNRRPRNEHRAINQTIKKAKRKGPVIPIAVAVDPKRWSGTGRSWVGDFQTLNRNESLPAFGSLFKDGSATLRYKLKIKAEKESKMALANSKDKGEQAPQERARAAIEAYPSKPGELITSKQILVRKGQRLDVDGVLARSFRDVESISPALNQQSFEQGGAS
jgi:hypothetical protein